MRLLLICSLVLLVAPPASSLSLPVAAAALVGLSILKGGA